MSNKLKIKDLVPDDANFNTGTEFGNALIDKSLSKFGAGRSILLDKNNRIIAGNKTIENAASNGFDDIIVVETTGKQIVAVKRTDIDLDTKRGREMALADNATAKANISWDAEPLKDWDMPLEEWGVFLDEPEVVAGDADAEPQIDKAAELNKKWKVKSGDLWLIGEHRLLCGDSTNPQAVETVLNGAKPNLMVTDPPYGIKRDKGFGGFGGFGPPIARRTYEDDWDSDRPEQSTFFLLLENCEKAIIFGGNFFADLLPVSTHWLVWDKENTMPTFGDCELAWTNIDRHSVKQYTIQYNGLIGKEADRFHPTQKPVALIQAVVGDYAKDDDAVFDAYAGSGTTLVACQNLNRKCYAIEISPAYCSVILERMQNAFPELTIKRVENGKSKAA